MKIKILVLASNPKGTPVLELPAEVRNLREVIKKSPERDRFIIETRLAVRPKDLHAALLEVKPRIVRHINFVIGMNQPILDLSAIAFAEGFYGALGAGQSVIKAYEFGCNRIHLEFGDNSSQPRKLLPVLTETENSSRLLAEHLIPILLTKDNPTTIEQPEELTTMQPESRSKGNNISFGNQTTVQGDVIAGDQTKTTTYRSDESDKKYSQAELLELLNELKTCLKQATIDEDEKDIVTGQVAGAIYEVKQSNPEAIGDKKDKISEYLQETKTILDRVKDVGEIGAKAFPIVKKIATMLGISLL